MSAREMLLALLELHVLHNMPQGLMDKMLSLFSAALPGPHFLPRSIHLLREVTGTPHHSRFQVHVCSAAACPGHEYPNLEKSKWPEHADDTCPKCNTKRFKSTILAGRYGVPRLGLQRHTKARNVFYFPVTTMSGQ